MADTTISWDDVGRRFAELGRKLEDTWRESREDGVGDDLRDAGEKVKTAIDDVAEAIDRAIASDEVRDAGRSAAAGVTGALAATLHQVAGWIEDATPSRRRPPPPTGADTGPAAGGAPGNGSTGPDHATDTDAAGGTDPGS